MRSSDRGRSSDDVQEEVRGFPREERPNQMLATARALMTRPKLTLLETGTLVMQGRADELLRDEGVKKAYLGI